MCMSDSVQTSPSPSGRSRRGAALDCAENLPRRGWQSRVHGATLAPFANRRTAVQLLTLTCPGPLTAKSLHYTAERFTLQEYSCRKGGRLASMYDSCTVAVWYVQGAVQTSGGP